MNAKTSLNKSYLKWAGGKSRIMPFITDLLGEGEGKRLIEPFVGSGAVALNTNFDSYLLNDLNHDLIWTHLMAYEYPEDLIGLLIAPDVERENYYELRDEFNAKSNKDLRKAALFIYLNKHGFNGMCRYNASGKYNIPAGKSKTIHSPHEQIENFKKDIGYAIFTSEDFLVTISEAGEGDVVYCDPPYIPASATMSDINYTGEPFTYKHHENLREAAVEAAGRGAKVFISNHDTDVTRNLYRDAEIHTVDAWRSISSTTKTRGKIGELVAVYG